MVNIFIAYSHKDESLKDELLKHLAPLRRSKLITDWHDRKLLAGQKLDSEIDKKLKNSNIILLLISADFIDSDYCYEKEMRQAMKQEADGLSHVVPVILRHCVWDKTPFGKLLACPKDGRPITDFEDRDKGFADVAMSLRTLIEDILASQDKEEEVVDLDKVSNLDQPHEKKSGTFIIDNGERIYRENGLKVGDVTGPVEEKENMIIFSEISNAPIPDSNQIIFWKKKKLQFMLAHSYTGISFTPQGVKNNVLTGAKYKVIS